MHQCIKPALHARSASVWVAGEWVERIDRGTGKFSPLTRRFLLRHDGGVKQFPSLAAKAETETLHESFIDGAAVDIGSTDHSFRKLTRGIYFGGAGAIVLAMASSKRLTFAAVPVGAVLKVAAAKVINTNTTATNLLGLY
jgi:hypothetical protein